MKHQKNSASMQRFQLSAVFSAFFLIIFPMLSLAQDPAPAAGAVPADASAAPVIEDDEGSITLDFKEADINTVLRVMSLKSKINIVAGPEVQGTVTIRLENVPWQKALDVVLRTYGYVYERDGNIIRVTTRDNLAQEPLVTQTFILNYSKAVEIQGAVQDMLTERGRVKVSERTNTIVLTDIPTNIYTIGEVIKKLDRMTPQAYIDSKIVKTSLAATENLGIQWLTGGANNLGSISGASRPVSFPFSTNVKDGNEQIPTILEQFFPQTSSTTTATQNPTSPRGFPLDLSEPNPTYQFGTLSFSSFSAILQLLKSRTDTKVISNPRVVVLNNQKAEIHVGDNIPLPKFETNSTTGRLTVSGFDYDKLKTGVNLIVTPHINSADQILVDLEPSVNARGDTITFNADLSAPIINETTAKSQVLIESGQTIAIGGLMTDNIQSSENKVPGLGDIPLVGKVFRSKRQTAGSGNEKVETIFFITVTMVDTGGQKVGKKADHQQPVVLPAPKPSASENTVTATQTAAGAQAAARPAVQVATGGEEQQAAVSQPEAAQQQTAA